MTDIFRDYHWHSAIEPTKQARRRRIIRSLVASAANLSRFMRVSKDSSLLIHKSTKALWKFADDNKTIVPAFDDDILTEDKL